MALFWNAKLAVGDESIDKDHKYLILLINTVELVLSKPDARKYIIEAFDALEAYAREHFEREEKIQLAISFKHQDEHRLAHKALLKSLSDLRGEVEVSLLSDLSSDTINPAEIERIAAFLRSWLIKHVVAEDFKMRELFKSRRVIR